MTPAPQLPVKWALQAKLLEVHRKTEDLRAAGRIERVQLAVNRSDYMLDEPSNTLLQVEAVMCGKLLFVSNSSLCPAGVRRLCSSPMPRCRWPCGWYNVSCTAEFHL